MTLAVSACLLGEKVRFDGGHKRDRFVTDTLCEYAEYVTFCPELHAFGAPRDSFRLVLNEGTLFAQNNKTKEDITAPLMSASHHDLEQIKRSKLGGIIFKSKSPSCGMGSAKQYLPNGHSEGKTDGLFVTLCKEAFPFLPMEEESRLLDPWLKENFIMHLFAYDRFERFLEKAKSMKDLVAFHTANKFLLQAKDELGYRVLGRIVANQDNQPFQRILEEYTRIYRQTIAKKSSKGRTRNVLEHMAGFVKDVTDSHEKGMLHGLIQDFANGIVPLISPISMLMLLAQKYDVSYLTQQIFLDPYPKALALRSSLESAR